MKFTNTLILLFSFIIINGQIEVDFVADQTIGCEAANISFTDLSISSSGNIISWSWEIGSVFSDLQNPGAILNQIGSYTICLTVTDQSGNVDSLCKENYITIYPNPEADFSFVQDFECSPSEVVFMDMSSGSSNIVNWIWDVGGSTNIINTQDPQEIITSTYQTGGSYTISLVIEDQNGCSDVVTQSNVIDVIQSPEPMFSFYLDESCELPITANFINLNIEAGVDYEWDFGNGENFSGSTPSSVNFEDDGQYLIALTARRDDCAAVYETLIDIVTDPQLDFQFPDAKCIYNNFKISNLANVSIDSVIWTTDTGLSFIGADMTTIRIDEPGCYFFSARVFINACEYLFAFSDCIEIKDIPQLNIDVNYLEACSFPVVVELSVDLPESANVNWIVDSPQGLLSLNGTDHIVEFSEPGSYGLDFEFIEGGACTHDYVLDDIVVSEFGIVDPGGPLGGCLPINYNLNFQVNTVSPIIYHEWSIPDLGITSNDENLLVSLTNPGAHDVIYIVENEHGCRDTIFLEDYISAGNMPEVGFDVFPIEQCADDAFQLTDQSSDFANEWLWLFSDSLNTEWSFGEELLEIITDTGWIDIYHTAAQYGCFGDTLLVENAIHILGPGARFTIEQACNSMDVYIENHSIAADYFYFQIVQGLDTFLIEQDSFWFTFNQSGPVDIEIFTFNDSTGCEMNLLKSIFIPDFDLGFVTDTDRGCVPFEVTFEFQENPLLEFKTEFGVITDISNGSATVRYDEAGAFPSPYLLRYRDDCIDTISIDSIFVNELIADFENNPVFCAPDDHELINTSTSVFGDIVSSQWSLNPGNIMSDDFDPVFYIDKDTILNVKLIIEDNWGCMDTLERPFAIKPRFLEAGFSSNQLLCVGQSVQFNNSSLGDELIEFLWDFGDGNTSNEFAPVHQYQDEGLYDVCLIIFDNINCSDTFCVENYIEIRNPIANFAGDPLSINCPPLLTDFQNLSSYATSFIWDFGDNSGLSFLESPAHIYNDVGTFDVSLIASNEGSCPDTLLLVEYVEVDGPSGEWVFLIESGCIPLDVSFIGSSDGPYKYVWDFGNGEITPPSSDRYTDTISYSYVSPGIYVPKLLLDNNEGCIISVSGDTIVANDLFFDVDVGDSTYCVSPGEILIDNHTISSGENLQFFWAFTNGIENYTSELDNPEFSILNAGQYELVLYAETENCRDSLSIEGVQIIESINVAATNDTICYDTFSEIEVSGDANYFEWFTIQGDYVGNSDSLALKLKESQDFYVVAYRESCPNDTAFAYVEVYDPVVIDLEREYTSYENSFPQVELSYEGNYAFNWSPPGGLSCLTCPEPFIMPDSITTYHVEVLDLESGCMIEDLINVETVRDCVKEGLHTPNIFSPNRDGVNDGVRVYTQRETDFISLGIYDRWGNLMFFSEDINESWDGIHLSQPAITGVYTLKINGICTDSGKPFVVYRDVSLVR